MSNHFSLSNVSKYLGIILGLAGIAILTVCIVKIARGEINFSYTGLATIGVIAVIVPIFLFARKDSKIKIFGTELSMSEITERVTENATEKVVSKLISPMEEGSYLINHNKAFEKVNEILKNSLDDQSVSEIDLRFLGVSLRYSFDFIHNELVEIMSTYKKLNITFRITVIISDSTYLNTVDMSKNEYDWSARSSEVEYLLKHDTKEKIENYKLKNVNMYFSKINAIPQFHGLLINGKHLFLGKTDWKKTGKAFNLTVGSNEYRYFNTKTGLGKSRIDNFRHWFDFYSTDQTKII